MSSEVSNRVSAYLLEKLSEANYNSIYDFSKEFNARLQRSVYRLFRWQSQGNFHKVILYLDVLGITWGHVLRPKRARGDKWKAWNVVLGKSLKEIRVHRNLSCRDVASMCGFYRLSINRRERGEGWSNKIAMACRVMEEIGVDLHEFADMIRNQDNSGE